MTAVERGRWLESLLAVVAAMVAVWPVGRLVAEQPWVQPLAGTLLLVAVVGCLVRTARGPRWVVVLAQFLALISALAWWLREYAMPGESSVATARALLHEGVLTIQDNPVPAPATPGLILIVLASSALLGLLIDVIAVTLRAPAVSGIPLLLLIALTASSSGDPLDPRYFLALAAAWLLLLAREGRNRLEAWRSAGARTRATTVDAPAASRGSRRRAGSVARVMGVTALGLAVLLPGALPHLPTTALLDGLTRSGDDGTGSVTFTETLDLAQDLADRSNAPVIRYRTDETSPPPLRVAVSGVYTDGQWLPAKSTYAAEVTTDELMTFNSLILEMNGVETSTATLTVTHNGLRAPQLALPYPTTAVDLGDIGWQWDPYADVALADAQPQTYAATYLQLAPLATLPENIGAPPRPMLDGAEVAQESQAEDGRIIRTDADGMTLEVVEPDGRVLHPMTDASMMVTETDGSTRRDLLGESADPLALEPVFAERVQDLTAEVVGEHTNQIDIATEIQRYLRGPEFTYSLTLADPVEGPDGEPLDPLSHFLETKQGYCTQFATAMVMMARTQDIPARLAIGFLPGDAGLDGTRTVVASDAHAWPELFINGLGWTRFEPTPGARSGLAPYYQTAEQPEEAVTAAPDPEVEAPTAEAAVPDSPAEQGRRSAPGWFERHGTSLGQVGLGLAAAALVLAALPAAAWWRRERWRHRRGLDDTASIEGEWSVLVAGLADLGVRAPAGATPRALRDHYARVLEPDAAVLDALTRATDQVEAARYTAGPTPAGTMREDVRRVLAWRRRSLPRGQRLAAWLAPESGRVQLQSLLPGRTRPSGA